jgi:hypothetical protein
LAIALPYLVVLVVRGDADGSANADLDRRGALIRWGSGDLGFVRDLYPPLPTGLAGALPGGPVLLGVAGALVAGYVLEMLVERLRSRGHPWWFSTSVVLGVGAMPMFGRTALDDLATFAGIALVLAAVAGLLEFTVLGDTGGGFRAGLALGFGVACGLEVAVYAIAIGVSAPLIAWKRYRGVPYAARAAMLVLLFPPAAALAGWTFLEWRFSGGAFQSVRFDGGGLDALPATGLAVLTSPVFLLSAAILVRRAPTAAAALLVPVLGLLVSAALGLSEGGRTDHIALALLGALTIPPNLSRGLARWYVLAVVLQVGLTSLG